MANTWRVDVGRFRGLHAYGQDLVRGWIDKAVKSNEGDEFEAFIYAWIGFNGWASCCCAEDGDRALLHMMMLDEGLTRNYARIAQGGEATAAAGKFASYWPIFRVSHLAEVDTPEPAKSWQPGRVVAYYHQSNPEETGSGMPPKPPRGIPVDRPTPSKRSIACGATCSTDRSPGPVTRTGRSWWPPPLCSSRSQRACSTCTDQQAARMTPGTGDKGDLADHGLVLADHAGESVRRSPRCERVAGRSIEVIRQVRALMLDDGGQVRAMRLLPFTAAAVHRTWASSGWPR